MTQSGGLKTEGQLINLMHCRYVDGLRDLCTMWDADLETMKKMVEMANKLSTLNVDKYGKEWGKHPSPQKILEISPDGHILCTEKYVPES